MNDLDVRVKSSYAIFPQICIMKYLEQQNYC